MDRQAKSIALEKAHVHDVYDKIAPHFSDTRYKAWPRVKQFLQELDPGSIVADVGCGNGRYLPINANTFKIGSDRCCKLLEIAHNNGHEVMACDNIRLPYRDNCFDAVISIAVIHHFATIERRIQALQELARILRPGGKLMVYVWAMEQKQRKFDSQDVLVPWHLQPRYHKHKAKRLQDLKNENSSYCSSTSDDDQQSETTPRRPKLTRQSFSTQDTSFYRRSATPSPRSSIHCHKCGLPQRSASDSGILVNGHLNVTEDQDINEGEDRQLNDVRNDVSQADEQTHAEHSEMNNCSVMNEKSLSNETANRDTVNTENHETVTGYNTDAVIHDYSAATVNCHGDKTIDDCNVPTVNSYNEETVCHHDAEAVSGYSAAIVNGKSTEAANSYVTATVNGCSTEVVHSYSAATVDSYSATSVDGFSTAVDNYSVASVDGCSATSVDGFSAAVDNCSAASFDCCSAASVNGNSSEVISIYSAETVDGYSAAAFNGYSVESVNGYSSATVNGHSTESVTGHSAESVNGYSAESIDGYSAADSSNCNDGDGKGNAGELTVDGANETKERRESVGELLINGVRKLVNGISENKNEEFKKSINVGTSTEDESWVILEKDSSHDSVQSLAKDGNSAECLRDTSSESKPEKQKTHSFTAHVRGLFKTHSIDLPSGSSDKIEVDETCVTLESQKMPVTCNGNTFESKKQRTKTLSNDHIDSKSATGSDLSDNSTDGEGTPLRKSKSESWLLNFSSKFSPKLLRLRAGRTTPPIAEISHAIARAETFKPVRSLTKKKKTLGLSDDACSTSSVDSESDLSGNFTESGSPSTKLKKRMQSIEVELCSCNGDSEEDVRNETRKSSNYETSHSETVNDSDTQDTTGADLTDDPSTYKRYYHVFKEGELVSLVEEHVESLYVLQSYFDHANWCVVAEKVQVWKI